MIILRPFLILLTLIFALANLVQAQSEQVFQKFYHRKLVTPHLPQITSQFDNLILMPSYLGHSVYGSMSLKLKVDTRSEMKSPQLNIDQSGNKDSSAELESEFKRILRKIFETESGRLIRDALTIRKIDTLDFHLHAIRSEVGNLFSWTDRYRKIHVFIARDRLPESELIKILTHELVQLALFSDTLEIQRIVGESYHEMNQLKALMMSLSHTEHFQLVLNTSRAFAFETQILSELTNSSSISSTNLNMHRIESCVELVQKVSLAISRMPFRTDINQLALDRSGEYSSHAEDIERFMHLFSKNDLNELVCRKLLVPHISPSSQGRSGWGPRPGIGGTDGN